MGIFSAGDAQYSAWFNEVGIFNQGIAASRHGFILGHHRFISGHRFTSHSYLHHLAVDILRHQLAVNHHNVHHLTVSTLDHEFAIVRHYDLALLHGQQAILARTAEGRPYFAVFIYSEGEVVNLIHVIAGRKLSALTG